MNGVSKSTTFFDEEFVLKLKEWALRVGNDKIASMNFIPQTVEESSDNDFICESEETSEEERMFLPPLHKRRGRSPYRKYIN